MANSLPYVTSHLPSGKWWSLDEEIEEEMDEEIEKEMDEEIEKEMDEEIS